MASRISPVPNLIKIGVIKTLGKDSLCSKNNADMLEVMKTSLLLHRSFNKDPTPIPADKVLQMTTIEDVKALLDLQMGSKKISESVGLVNS